MNVRQKTTIVFLIGVALLLHVCRINPNISETEVERHIFELINNHRESNNLTKLTWDEIIAEQCRIHSSNMASKIVPFGHAGFDGRMAIIGAAIPFSQSGENLAYLSGYSDPADSVVNKWLENEEHRINIEGGFSLSGVGVARNNRGDYFITQIFIKN